MTATDAITIIDQLPDRSEIVAAYVAAGLTQDAAERMEEHAEHIQRIRQRAIFDIGRELLVARETAQHGTWLAFLQRIELSESTARNYMNVAERFRDTPALISATVADLPPGIQYALAAPKADPVAVGEIIAEVAAGAPVPSVVTVRERVTSKPAPVESRPTAPAGPTERPTPAPVIPPALALPAAPVPGLPPPLPGLGALTATVTEGFDVQRLKLLVAKQQILALALEVVEAELASTAVGPTIEISTDRAREAARSFLVSPALGGAAALLALGAVVLQEVEA